MLLEFFKNVNVGFLNVFGGFDASEIIFLESLNNIAEELRYNIV